jgi:hypothetical protein
MSVYQYAATATAGMKFDSERLHRDISKAGLLSAALQGVTVQGVGVAAIAHIAFTQALSAPDEATLSAVVAAHTGAPLYPPRPPAEADGKPIVVTTPGTVGWLTWFHGAGDQTSPLVRAGGQPIMLAIDAIGDHSVTWQYAEPVEMHDGQIQLEGQWSVRDTLDLSVVIPATPATENLGGTGNANRVEIAPSSGLYAYVPAAGNGAYDIDLAQAVPVPDRATQAGWWDADYDTGEVTPAPIGGAMFNLFSFPVESYFMSGIPLGTGHKTIDVDVYRTDWLHPAWSLRATVHKATIASGETSYWAGWMLCFRRFNTRT